MASCDLVNGAERKLSFTGLVVAGEISDDAGQELLPLGSGFFVAPYIALSARHVIDEIAKRFHGCTLPEIKDELAFGIDFAVLHPQYGLMKWAVMGYGYTSTVDVVALLVEPRDPVQLPEGFKWELPTLSFAQAVEGEEISALGYPQSYHRFDSEVGSRVRIQPHSSNGYIRQIHELRRDSAMLPYPCYETDARIEGGMSGGPVFNSAGQVCGVINSSFELELGGGEPVSYVAALWPCAGIELTNTVNPISKSPKPYYLQALVDDGLIKSVDRMTSVDSGGKVTILVPSGRARGAQGTDGHF